MGTSNAEHRADRRRLLLAAFLRATATALGGVVVGFHFARVGLDAGAIGALVAAGLVGAALAALWATLAADRIGRRRFLVAVAVLSAAGGLGLLASKDPFVLGACAFVGMLNGMGRDRGAALVLDQVILPATTTDAARTRAFAAYNVFQDAGHALGSILVSAPVIVAPMLGATADSSDRALLGLYVVLMAAVALVYRGLSPAVEARAPAARIRLAPESRRIVTRISALFAVDGLGGGFLTSALLSYYFFQRFGASEAAVGMLFFGARVANAGSHVGAAWLARRIGLVNTMVFTHIPSSLLLVTVAWAPSFPVAAALFLLREGLVEMDVPTRQSYVMAVVRPEERTLASGITHLVRLGSWAVAPAVAGVLMTGVSTSAPLYAGAALKIGYDVALFAAFRRVHPPEER